MTPLTVGSLFAGIGGFDLGFERAGMVTRWQVEQDEFCRKVLARHFPHAKRYEDVRDVGASNLERVDVLCGGFPCQDISNAGARAGITGERSGLWAEFYRLICELRPEYVVVENVAAILGRGLDVVLACLAEIGMDAEWTTLRASDVGAPHPRERFWLVAYPASGTGQTRDCLGTCEAWRPPLEPAGVSSLPMAPRWEPRGFWRDTEPPADVLAHGFPEGMDANHAAGNALVPQIAEWIGRRIVQWEHPQT